jgi:hypothetical protein
MRRPQHGGRPAWPEAGGSGGSAGAVRLGGRDGRQLGTARRRVDLRPGFPGLDPQDPPQVPELISRILVRVLTLITPRTSPPIGPCTVASSVGAEGLEPDHRLVRATPKRALVHFGCSEGVHELLRDPKGALWTRFRVQVRVLAERSAGFDRRHGMK